MAEGSGDSGGGGGERPTALESHAGSWIQIRNDGMVVVDTYVADGGDVLFRLKGSAKFRIVIGDTLAIEVSKQGTVRIDLGENADQRLVLGDALLQLLNDFWQTKYDFHTHPTAMGPSGPPLPLFTGTRMTDNQLSDIAKTKKR